MAEQDDEEITDNVLRMIETSPGMTADEIDFEDLLADDLGFTRKTLQELAFAINKDEYFKPLGVGLIPDDVADCETVAELVELVKKELNNEMPPRREKPPGRQDNKKA
jgi:hypothetical protein